MPGAERLHQSAALTKLLADQQTAGRLYAAICAAPAVVLKPQGLLDGITATCHPGFFDRLERERCVAKQASSSFQFIEPV